MSQTIELRVPDIGDFKNVPVVELSVQVGDVVAADQTVVMIESDKATLDIPAPTAGRVIALKVVEGDRVSTGSVLMLLEAVASAEQKAAPGLPPVPPADAPAPAVAPAPAPTAAPATAAAVGMPGGRASEGLPPHASPAVRKFARELGVDLAAVAGTGPRGRITREDIQSVVKAALRAPEPLSAAEGTGIGIDLLPWPKVDYAKFGPITCEPLSRIKKISGPNLARNATIIPHVTNFEDADITDLEAFRKTVNAELKDGVKLSILPFVVKACVAALKAYPAFNSSLDGDALVLKQYYNIGVAADTPEGLVVPVVKAADSKGIQEIAAEMADLAADARAGRLKAADIQGATFTISSLGGIGGTNFTPIINAPEVAIFGMVRAAVKPVWDGTAFQPRLIQPMSLSWDHRVVDGVAAAKFLVFVKTILADFRRISL
ncbi:MULTISPECIES: 2-oxo acid dehydrogenase subunit E2 [unclassified Xanthobacter]|uniref:2-oxo acid dehydrogenase subunit E2 n=1 Tax=unclassified Xanthobacter TaxID=2623496 RepID=UPI001F26F48D|nr:MULTISPECIES: 2-oxo acid dehydrogenase subunit E2 [unclassified Xanthobacter]